MVCRRRSRLNSSLLPCSLFSTLHVRQETRPQLCDWFSLSETHYSDPMRDQFEHGKQNRIAFSKIILPLPFYPYSHWKVGCLRWLSSGTCLPRNQRHFQCSHFGTAKVSNKLCGVARNYLDIFGFFMLSDVASTVWIWRQEKKTTDTQTKLQCL